jgi:VIT1/CCC1 family predicted Fe2+/Mn2+ transporter
VTPKLLRKQAVFGAADGVTIALGLVVSVTGHPDALVHAALGAGLAELVGMTAGAWLSDSGEGFRPALANGAAAFLACALPAVPYAVTHGLAALVSSLLLVAVIAAVISWLRPEKGVLAIAQTYGILLVAAALCYAASFI